MPPSGEKRRFDGPLANVASGAGVLTSASRPSAAQVSVTPMIVDPFSHTSRASSGENTGAVPSPRLRGEPARVPATQISRCGGSGSERGFGLSPCELGAPPRTNATASPLLVIASCESSMPSSAVYSTTRRADSPSRMKLIARVVDSHVM